jgi:hypothetical protein
VKRTRTLRADNKDVRQKLSLLTSQGKPREPRDKIPGVFPQIQQLIFKI